MLELPDIVASLGYDWMELSPKEDFVPFFKYPRADDATVKQLKKKAKDAGVGIASVLPVLRWAGPDETQRQAAVRAWKRAIQITVDLGVDTMNTEFNGRPEAAEFAESQFMRSLDELLPIFEKEGLKLVLEPHPDDFIEDGLAAVNMVKGLNADFISFLYCTPHTFHQGNDPAGIIARGRATGQLRASGRHAGPQRVQRFALHRQSARIDGAGTSACRDGSWRGRFRRCIRRAGCGRLRRRDLQLCVRLGRAGP